MARPPLIRHVRDLVQGTDVKLGRVLCANTTPITNNLAGTFRSAIARRMAQGEARGRHRQFECDGIMRFPDGLVPADAVATVAGAFRDTIDDPALSTPYGEVPDAVMAHAGRLFGRRILDPRLLPGMASLLSAEVVALVEATYRSRFQVLSIEAYRTMHVPDQVHRAMDAYSSWWHCDQRATDITKLMINVSDVSACDGPFAAATRETTSKWLGDGRFAAFGRRIDSGFEVADGELAAGQVVELTGPPGSAMLCNTQLCMHRAGIPREGRTRDIVQIVFAASARPLAKDWVSRSDPGYGLRWRYHQPRLAGGWI